MRAAPSRLKHQIKSRLIQERRKIAKPMKSYTIQAINPETTRCEIVCRQTAAVAIKG